MLIVFDVLPLDSRANIECRRINARFCESSGLHTYASFSPRSRHTTDVLFFPFYGHRSLHLPCRYRRDGAGPGRYFQVFLRRRFARYLPLSRCLCPTGFATALRPYSPGISCKNVMLAHVSPYDHLRIRLSNRQTIEPVKRASRYCVNF